MSVAGVVPRPEQLAPLGHRVQLLPAAVVNDLAIIINAFAVRMDSDGAPENDLDVVLVPLCWRRHPPASAAHAADTERVEATPCRTLGHGPAEPAPRDYSTCRGGPY